MRLNGGPHDGENVKGKDRVVWRYREGMFGWVRSRYELTDGRYAFVDSQAVEHQQTEA